MRVDAHDRRGPRRETKVDDVHNLGLNVDVLGPERPGEQRLRVRRLDVEHLVHVHAASFAEAHHGSLHHGADGGRRSRGEEFLGEDGDGGFHAGGRVLAAYVHTLGRRSLEHAVEHPGRDRHLRDGVRREQLQRAEQRLRNLRKGCSQRRDW